MIGKHPVDCCMPLKLKFVTNGWLAINFLALAEIRAYKLLIHSKTSWPYLISELLVTGSSWSQTFFHPRSFCLECSLDGDLPDHNNLRSKLIHR